MLRESDHLWESLDVNYEPPRVERLWRKFGDFRIYLHRIHPCEKALFHPHPWPSAVEVLSGAYEMGIGYGAGPEAPPTAATAILRKGSSYEMIDPNGWHYVRPFGDPSLSIMVTGKPWLERHQGTTEVNVPLGPLSHEDRVSLIRAVQALL